MLDIEVPACHYIVQPDNRLVTRREGKNPLLTSYSFLATYLRAKFGDDQRGASLVEYALLVALIAVVCIVAITFLGGSAKSKFSSTNGK